MKKLLLLVICTLFCFTGCNTTVETPEEDIKVNITGTNKDDYSVTFEYKGQEYTVIDPELYEEYKNKIGETADAVITYLDESGTTDKVIELLPEIQNAAGSILHEMGDFVTEIPLEEITND